MRLELRPHESILHPQPYVQEEYNPVIVTSQRVISRQGRRRVIMEARDVTYVGKGVDRRFMMIAVIFAVLGLPFAVFGAYSWFSVRGLPSGPPDVPEGQKAPVIKPRQRAEFERVMNTRIMAVTFAVFGAAFVGGAYLLYKRRLQVVVGGRGRVLRMRVKNGIEQDKLMTMLGAARTAAAAMPAPGAAAKPPPGTAPPAAPQGPAFRR